MDKELPTSMQHRFPQERHSLRPAGSSNAAAPDDLLPMAGRSRSRAWDGNGGRHCPSYIRGWDNRKGEWVERIYYAGAADGWHSGPWKPSFHFYENTGRSCSLTAVTERATRDRSPSLLAVPRYTCLRNDSQRIAGERLPYYADREIRLQTTNHLLTRAAPIRAATVRDCEKIRGHSGLPNEMHDLQKVQACPLGFFHSPVRERCR
jgi:hypothetical protein